MVTRSGRSSTLDILMKIHNHLLIASVVLGFSVGTKSPSPSLILMRGALL
jgi:hypothetical protein